MKMPSILFISLLLTCGAGEEPAIIIDNRPAAGIPLEASSQKHPKNPSPEGLETLRSIMDGTIKTVRIRYFNKETWATEKEAKEYLSNFLTHQSLRAYGFEIWSFSPPGVPEIECIELNPLFGPLYMLGFQDRFCSSLVGIDRSVGVAGAEINPRLFWFVAYSSGL